MPFYGFGCSLHNSQLIAERVSESDAMLQKEEKKIFIIGLIDLVSQHLETSTKAPAINNHFHGERKAMEKESFTRPELGSKKAMEKKLLQFLHRQVNFASNRAKRIVKLHHIYFNMND